MVAVFKSDVFDHEKIESLKNLHSCWSEFIYERVGEYDGIQIQVWTKELDALGKAIGLIEQKSYMPEYQKFDIPDKNINYWLNQLADECYEEKSCVFDTDDKKFWQDNIDNLHILNCEIESWLKKQGLEPCSPIDVHLKDKEGLVCSLLNVAAVGVATLAYRDGKSADDKVEAIEYAADALKENIRLRNENNDLRKKNIELKNLIDTSRLYFTGSPH